MIITNMVFMKFFAGAGQPATPVEEAGPVRLIRYHRFHFGGCILLAILIGSMYR